ncbi:MAG: uroporphyrinogen-III C-methyltransferase [Actinomycetales bacterium]|nr:MAG: uroporphyrinogen-III C-methyltransferase [Actinomycetales bacterium]
MSYTLDVRGRRVAVVGGDLRAATEATALREAGAQVTVVADVLADTLHDLVERGLLDHARTVPTDVFLTIRVQASTSPAGDSLPELVEGAVGSVTLVGAGPGDPGLLTIAGRDALVSADVVVTDRLVPLEALRLVPPESLVIDVAKIPGGRSTPQEEINRILVEHALAGRTVVRLKGGDPFVFGRGGEELLACAKAGVPTRLVPGVSSAISAPGLAGIPVTHRGVTQGFTVISGHVPPGHPESTLDYRALAASGTTLVVLMGVRTLAAITDALVAAGLPPHTPAAVVADAGLPSQRDVRGTVDAIAELAETAGIGAPAVAVIGAVADVDGLP